MAQDFAKVRRQNREVRDEQWIHDFLHRTPTCVIGSAQDGRVFLNPNLFLYDEERRRIYFHTAGTGRTRDNIESKSDVTLCFFEMGRLLPAEKVTDYSTEYASVVIFGKTSVVEDPVEGRWVLTTQMKKYFPDHLPGRDFTPFTDEEMGRAAIFRVEIERWSAKRNQEPADYPGAFLFSVKT